MLRKIINQNMKLICLILFVTVCAIFGIEYYYYGYTKPIDNPCVKDVSKEELRISNCSYPKMKEKTNVYKLKLMIGDNMVLHGYPPWDLISRIVGNKGKFKPVVDEVIYNFLSRNPSAIFIDVGANLGLRSLQVANYKRKVIAIEALGENVYRFCRSKIDNKITDEISILHYALTEGHKSVQLAKYNGCMGCTFIADDKDVFRSRHKMVRGLFDEIVPTITMDDLLTLNDVTSSSNVFIKMDIEGYEHIALDGGHTFFQCKDVIGVLMVWRWHKRFESKFKIKKFMEKYGFVPYKFDARGKKYTSLSWNTKQGADFPDYIVWLSSKYEYLTY